MKNERIFGLGLSRTGTTSLHAAAVILGYSSVHYPSHLAPQWMAANFSPASINPFEFYTDLPVPVYFRDFDRAWPNARFILTYRDPEIWIESAERWFASEPPSSPKTIQRDVIRLISYGVHNFHRQHFLDVYRRHVDQVREYFRNRPGDFLFLDIANEPAPWGLLCGFLDRPVPGQKFPHLKKPSLGNLQMVLPEEVAEKRLRICQLVA